MLLANPNNKRKCQEYRFIIISLECGDNIKDGKLVFGCKHKLLVSFKEHHFHFECIISFISNLFF